MEQGATRSLCFTSVILATGLVIASCAVGTTVLLKNGRPPTNAELSADELNCERQAALTYPFAQALSTRTEESLSGTQTNCSGSGGYISCNTYGSGPSSNLQTTDANAVNRQNYFVKCLATLGYEAVYLPPEKKSAIVASEGYVGTLSCERNADCATGQSCRSKKGGGSECRPSAAR
jgi:hypothetical protein